MAINRCSDVELPVHSRHTLHELLQWSPRGTKSLDCHCPSDDLSHHDFCYHEADPDVHLRSCNSDACTAKATRHRRRRTSLLVPHLPHSFMHALHHLPHSLSNALHHIPHLPHSISSALGQITHLTHSLSSAYKHHFASHRHGPDVHHAHDPKHHVAFHLRHLFSFKVHNRSVAHVGDPVATSSYGAHPISSAIPAPAAYSHSSKSSPSKERRLSASDYYMPIYTSKKHLKDGTVYHHHHHHHYHHHHYIL
ncbi:hypothetical protein KP509_07G018500 [Ceratopteris richardii]|nr:hypothetical protein KP509_07G018500 [Ceratopteris richardii]